MTTTTTAVEGRLRALFLGTWRTVRTDGMEQLREVFSLDPDAVPNNPSGEIRIHLRPGEGEAGARLVSTSVWGAENVMSMELGVPARHTILGREMELVMAWEGGDRLTIREVSGKGPMISRQVVDGQLISVVHINDFVITTVAERV